MLTPRRSPARRRFRQDAGGASAVEFALILPVMLTLWVGMAEMSHAVSAWRRVTLLSRTVADLTSKGDTTDPIASATMTDILASSTAVLRPFAGSSATIVVSALGYIKAKSQTAPYVCSSAASSNGKARAVGVASDLTVPKGYDTDGNRYLLAEVSMPYAPMIGSAIVNFAGGNAGAITLSTSFAWPVRNGLPHNSTNGTPEVTMPSGNPCP